MAEARRATELAVLSAMVHGGGNVETAVKIALATLGAVHELDRDRFLLYFDLVRTALSEAGKKALKMHPQGIQFFDESLQQSFTRGRAAEKATDVLDILDARGLAVSDAQRDRIIGCSDLDLLTLWHRRAITADSTDSIFG